MFSRLERLNQVTILFTGSLDKSFKLLVTAICTGVGSFATLRQRNRLSPDFERGTESCSRVRSKHEGTPPTVAQGVRYKKRYTRAVKVSNDTVFPRLRTSTDRNISSEKKKNNNSSVGRVYAVLSHDLPRCVRASVRTWSGPREEGSRRPFPSVWKPWQLDSKYSSRKLLRTSTVSSMGLLGSSNNGYDADTSTRMLFERQLATCSAYV